jgi:hypothetical protein
LLKKKLKNDVKIDLLENFSRNLIENCLIIN